MSFDTTISHKAQVSVADRPDFGVVQNFTAATESAPEMAEVYFPSNAETVFYPTEALTLQRWRYQPLMDDLGNRYTEQEAAALPVSHWNEYNVRRIED